MIPLLDTILLETRFESRVLIISEQFEYLENQFNSNFPKVRDQVTINTYHLARDQQQISKLTEKTEFLIEELLKVNENIINLKSSIEVLTSRQIKFEEKTKNRLAAINRKIDSLTEQFETLSLN